MRWTQERAASRRIIWRCQWQLEYAAMQRKRSDVWTIEHTRTKAESLEAVVEYLKCATECSFNGTFL